MNAYKLSLGAVVRQEHAQSAAPMPVVEEAGAVVQQAAVFRIDPTRSGAAVEALLGAEFGDVIGSDRSAYVIAALIGSGAGACQGCEPWSCRRWGICAVGGLTEFVADCILLAVAQRDAAGAAALGPSAADLASLREPLIPVVHRKCTTGIDRNTKVPAAP